MTEQNQLETATPPKKPRRSANADKWGAKVLEQGFCMIPSLLLRAQRRLHLNPSQLDVNSFTNLRRRGQADHISRRQDGARLPKSMH
jgi:hypothetical protein